VCLIEKYLVLGLCDPIDPFVTIVLLVCLLASHKWWYITQVHNISKSIPSSHTHSLSQTLLEESRIWIIWIISCSSKICEIWIEIFSISFIQIFYGNLRSNSLKLEKCFLNYRPYGGMWRPRFLINHNRRSTLLIVVKSRSTWVLTSKNSPTNPNGTLDQVDTHVGSTHGQSLGQTPPKP
jgi:hypothetical protein